jgi:hypothetical protein
VDSLETTEKMDFHFFEENNIQSPEDKYERLHHNALSHMN